MGEPRGGGGGIKRGGRETHEKRAKLAKSFLTADVTERRTAK